MNPFDCYNVKCKWDKKNKVTSSIDYGKSSEIIC
jgi:hypothetical protein